jgi:hypothetical protein
MQGFCSHNVGSLKNGPLREGRSRGLLDAEKPDGLMDRIRAGNGPKSVQEPGVQKTFVFELSLLFCNQPIKMSLPSSPCARAQELVPDCGVVGCG